MNQGEELLVLIKAAYRICKILKVDEKAHPFLCIESINARLRNKINGNEGRQHDLVAHVKQSLLAFISFYRVLYAFCGGDVAFMNHWLNVKNKSFGVPPRDMLRTCEGIERLNRYLDELRAHND